MKGIMSSLLVACFSVVSWGQLALADADLKLLKERLSEEQTQTHAFGTSKSFDWLKVAKALGEEDFGQFETCTDVRKETLAGKYVVTFDAADQPCRIYDLSFPTLATLFAGAPVSKLPVQKFGPRDYLNWLKGDYEAVLGKITVFQQNFTKKRNLKLASWVDEVKFRPQSFTALSANQTVPQTGLPKSFRASDLQVGSQFKFSGEQQAELANALDQLGAAEGVSVLSAEDRGAWKQAISNPESLLAKIKFEWNELEKVYDIFIEGEFLPISGPIALVDYSASYKFAVERILRSLVQTALDNLVRFVPGSAQQIVSLALDDAFASLDIAYDYQMNQLEGTLRAIESGGFTTSLTSETTTRGLNVLFGGRADVVEQYVLASAKGVPFDWTDLESTGKAVRYATEKNRDILLTNQHSDMVLRKGCEIELVHNYFGRCTKKKSVTLHSMISETHVMFWNLGAPMVYKEGRGYQVTLQRSASYMLSVGARMLDLPIVRRLSGYLSDALKNYAQAGIEDEAYLKNSLYLLKQSQADLSESEENMYKYLYIQNLNPFLPKSEASEQKVINANLNILEKAQ